MAWSLEEVRQRKVELIAEHCNGERSEEEYKDMMDFLVQVESNLKK